LLLVIRVALQLANAQAVKLPTLLNIAISIPKITKLVINALPPLPNLAAPQPVELALTGAVEQTLQFMAWEHQIALKTQLLTVAVKRQRRAQPIPARIQPALQAQSKPKPEEELRQVAIIAKLTQLIFAIPQMVVLVYTQVLVALVQPLLSL